MSTLLIGLVSVAAGWAQTPALPAGVTVSVAHGLSIGDTSGATKIQFGALVQADGHFVLGPARSPLTETFLLRRLRPILQGRVAKYFIFRIEPDFGDNKTVMQDAFIGLELSHALRVTVGKAHMPVGFELQIPISGVRFPERSLVSDLMPQRDVGVQAAGSLWADRLSYGVGVFNGVNDGSTIDTDTNAGEDIAARVIVRPFLRAGDGWWRGLGASLGGSHGQAIGPLPVYKTFEAATFFSYAAAASANGVRERVTPAVFYNRGPWLAYGEYARNRQAARAGVVNAVLVQQAWEGTASYVLTGETALPQGVTPRHPFDLAAGHWGAFELALRAGSIELDPRAIRLGLAAANASPTASGVGVAVDWYFNSAIKFVAAYERTAFSGGAPPVRPPENGLILRLQLNAVPRI